MNGASGNTLHICLKVRKILICQWSQYLWILVRAKQRNTGWNAWYLSEMEKERVVSLWSGVSNLFFEREKCEKKMEITLNLASVTRKQKLWMSQYHMSRCLNSSRLPCVLMSLLCSLFGVCGVRLWLLRLICGGCLGLPSWKSGWR